MSDLPPPLRLPTYTGGFYQLAYKVQYSSFVTDVHRMNPQLKIDRLEMETLWVDCVRQLHFMFMKVKSRKQAAKQKMLQHAILQPHALSSKMAQYWQARGDDSTMADLVAPSPLFGVPLEELMALSDKSPYLSNHTNVSAQTEAKIAEDEFKFGRMTALRLFSEKRNEAREAGMEESYLNSPAFITSFKAWLAQAANATKAGIDKNVAESPDFLKLFDEAL